MGCKPRVKTRLAGVLLGLLNLNFFGDLLARKEASERDLAQHKQVSQEQASEGIRVGVALQRPEEFTLKQHLLLNSDRLAKWADFRVDVINVRQAQRDQRTLVRSMSRARAPRAVEKVPRVPVVPLDVRGTRRRTVGMRANRVAKAKERRREDTCEYTEQSKHTEQSESSNALTDCWAKPMLYSSRTQTRQTSSTSTRVFDDESCLESESNLVANRFLESPAANGIAGLMFSLMYVKEQGLVKLRSKLALLGFHSSVSAAPQSELSQPG